MASYEDEKALLARLLREKKDLEKQLAEVNWHIKDTRGYVALWEKVYRLDG